MSTRTLVGALIGAVVIAVIVACAFVGTAIGAITAPRKTTSNYEITLVTQPGAPDKDRHGRLLRYAILANGSDFGASMVGRDHTGIYQGKDNDASRAYLDELYAHDLDHAANPPSGRECGQFPPPPPPVSYDDDTYVPLPDNDDDGESWFCRKRRWC